MISSRLLLSILASATFSTAVCAMEYAVVTAEPQKTGWPLSAESEAYVLKAEHERRPGSEKNQYTPALWPVVPSAGFWGGRAWLDHHAGLVKMVQANQGPTDVLLVGDSITIQWGDSWQRHFPTRKAINIGIGGDKTQNVLWRLDHGGVDGLEPRVIMLMIGNNNMFFTPETGTEAAALGIKACVTNLREKFPTAPLIVTKILPSAAPGVPFYEDTKKTNAAVDALNLSADPQVQVLDLWQDFVNSDGTIKPELYTADKIHLSPQGYAVWAAKLQPLIEPLLSKQP